MKYEAKIDTEYQITISDPTKFLEYYTSEDYKSVYFDFSDMDDILENLIMQFDSMDGSIDKLAGKYFKWIEGMGAFYFDNRTGWSTNDIFFEGCEFSICISEKETHFNQVAQA